MGPICSCLLGMFNMSFKPEICSAVFVEMYFFKFGGPIEFLDNSNSNWGRQTAVFQFIWSFNINYTSNLSIF